MIVLPISVNVQVQNVSIQICSRMEHTSPKCFSPEPKKAEQKLKMYRGGGGGGGVPA